MMHFDESSDLYVSGRNQYNTFWFHVGEDYDIFSRDMTYFDILFVTASTSAVITQFVAVHQRKWF